MTKQHTLIDLFENAVKSYPSNIFLMEKVKDKWTTATYKKVKEQVITLGAGFHKIGLKKGTNAALLCEGRNAWIISELALFYAGAINVPLSIKLEESNDLMFRLLHADCKMVIVSINQLYKIRKIKSQLPQIIKYVIINAKKEPLEADEISYEEVMEVGKSYLKTNRIGFLKIGHSLTNATPATITYTSGTTADPKGVILTHGNYTANVEQALTLMDVPSHYRTLIVLPLDHCFAHVVGFYIFMHKGATVATVQVGKTSMETLKNIPSNIKEVKPHIILSVPALAKNFKKSIEKSIYAKGKITEELFDFALHVSYLYNKDGFSRNKGITKLLKPLMLCFDKLFFSKIREAFGGYLKFFIGGGALLDKELQDFFYAVGMPMLQGYGLSEATPVISSNTLERHKFGTSGILVRPLEIAFIDNEGNLLPQGEQGEMLFKGENIMAGYWKNTEATTQTIIDGWLHSGDMGYIDKDGFLVVLGRFKSLLIGNDGEKYSPEGIEEALVSHSPYIDQIILYNNQDPYTVALIVPNIENLKRKCKEHRITWGTAEAQQESIYRIQHTLKDFYKGGSLAGTFPERWLPATFAVLPEPFNEQNRMVNSTLKIVRGEVERQYKERIAYLYTSEGKEIQNALNKAAIK